jgi:hypothetical protein
VTVDDDSRKNIGKARKLDSIELILSWSRSGILHKAKTINLTFGDSSRPNSSYTLDQ